MLRLFNTHKVRKFESLEGEWSFRPVPDGAQAAGVGGREFKMPVPGCWESHPRFASYQGKAVYRREVEIERDTAVRLCFQGVSHTADVYFDGRHVAHHYNAYTPFSAVVSGVTAGTHELVVEVDNGFGEASALHVPNDYYTYGGLIRPVSLEYVNELFIERIAFTPSMAKDGWQADIAVYVRNIGASAKNVQLAGDLAGVRFRTGDERIEAGQTKAVSVRLPSVDAAAWSPADPRLYLLGVRLFADGGAEPVDDLIERVGFRTVTTRGGRIQLNGEDIELKGFNRHEDHPLVGASFPYQLMVHDLELMAEAGANAVRTSHYPNDERFLDLCDERGLLVWEENHARGLSLAQMQNPNFERQCEDCNREMVESHFNHPSIVIWAILNECASDTPEGRVMYKKQLEQIRELDGSRPLTFASHHRDRELCFDLADIVSFNLYPLWYGDEDPGELCDLARGWADELGGLGKPMIMSEFGGDGHYGLRDPIVRMKGSEERHADIIESNLDAYTKRPFISGMFIWQFCDCRVSEGNGWLLSRAGTQNSKGIVDRYRRPKLAFDVVKKHFRRDG
ncbi:glycoside hydrolase family 2 protein [Paenibacillus arenilitoris]|uniref:Beta-glucuronidase n=1 Tax=Paenibacillus arenilitoris TaxID=2772299 RepID=A0A927H5Q7_9BACL|nr:glycoside hydrolase family 2 TIM barrel-domain containing protein [Paenibacillus arenilitoris]MBD2869195.1 beta-glucuronidase [Paenibacillus arenilitoris]